jgi:hypothetical protein
MLQMTDHFHGTENENPNHPIQKPVNPRSKTKTKKSNPIQSHQASISYEKVK